VGFVGAGLDRDSYDRQYSDRVLIPRILAYFKPYWRDMALATAAIILASLFSAAVPVAISRGIDMLVSDFSAGRLALIAAGVALLESSNFGLNYVRSVWSSRAVGNVVLQLRRDIFDAVIHHDLSFYDEQSTGKLVSRITSDSQDFSLSIELVMNLLSQVLAVVVIGVIAARINLKLTLIMLAFTPIVFAIALSYRKITRRVTLNARRVLAKVNANIQESVSGIAIAKGFRQEQTMYREFDALNRQTYRVNVTRSLTLQTIFPILTTTFGLASALMLYLAGRSAFQGLGYPADALPAGAISVGDWYLFMQAMGTFWFPIVGVASFWSQFQDGLSAAERCFALMDAVPQVVQTANNPVPKLRGAVDFDHVRLSYTGKEIVLPDFTLSVAPGESIALVGHTGAGKSSIARLLGRFYEFQGGRILIDGEDVRSFDLEQYRRQVGFVPQVPFLFSGNVLDNIRYGRPEATVDEVEAAARQVASGDWLADLPEGLQTDVGERGARLSMGQRQLVALARVLLQDPAIFVLDEATASVDPFTEAQIQEGLEAVMSQRTSIVIAHRLFTVRNANRIIVLRGGEIIEEGDHEALMAAGGHYAELYNTYFRHQSLEYIENAQRLAEAGA
jgi:ABC-type multidrug transport system fused ATPase/permease subunit